jgi:hypothetical protein
VRTGGKAGRQGLFFGKCARARRNYEVQLLGHDICRGKSALSKDVLLGLLLHRSHEPGNIVAKILGRERYGSSLLVPRQEVLIPQQYLAGMAIDEHRFGSSGGCEVAWLMDAVCNTVACVVLAYTWPRTTPPAELLLWAASSALAIHTRRRPLHHNTSTLVQDNCNLVFRSGAQQINLDDGILIGSGRRHQGLARRSMIYKPPGQLSETRAIRGTCVFSGGGLKA